MRILRWYMDGNISRSKTEVGGTYRLEDDYKPLWVSLTARIAGTGDLPLVIDINDDGESIFNTRPALTRNQTSKVWTTIPKTTLRKDSVITCDIDEIHNLDTCRDLTVEMAIE